MTALVIDDEQDIGQLLCRALQKVGVACEKAQSISEAKQQLQRKKYQVVFLDINLPDGNGLQLISTIKARHPEAGICVISAYQHPEEKENAFSSGADEFFSKPFSKKQVLAFLHSRL